MVNCLFWIAMVGAGSHPTTIPAIPEFRLAPDEVLWWGITNNLLVAVRQNGRCESYDIERATRVGVFTIPASSYRAADFALVPGERALLVVVRHEPDDNVGLFSLPVGTDLGAIECLAGRSLNVAGASTDGATLYCTSTRDGALMWVSLTQREVLRRLDKPAIAFAGGGVIFSPGGETVVYRTVKECAACDKQGNTLWRIAPSDPVRVDEIYPLPGPAPAVVAFDGKAARVVALLFADGHELWTRAVEGFTDFLTMSPDAKTQVFYTDDRLYVTQLPSERSKQLEWWDGGLPEAAFTPDGTRLVLMPALKIVERGPQVKFVETFLRLARSDRAFRVVDWKTGRLLSRVSLDPSTSQPAR
jgi:hypothetical protein